MRTYLNALVVAIILLTSCGQRQSSKDKSENQEEASTVLQDNDDFDKAKDCDEFIDQYEEWMNNYVELLEKYMKNPTDATISSEYLKVAQESMNWLTQWNSKLYFCAAKEKYQKRFEEITAVAEKKLEELGIE